MIPVGNHRDSIYTGVSTANSKIKIHQEQNGETRTGQTGDIKTATRTEKCKVYISVNAKNLLLLGLKKWV